MRRYFESLEAQHLAPYALKAADSKGRVHFQPESDSRTCFQRDRDRIIHAKAFRRLKHKTQVFITTKSDHFRTRLTHTLEVASISRHLARLLRVNEDVAESIALAHDLGHTPFGHSGERTLSRLMAEYGGFEHNQHSYRIVTQLESPYPGFKGLNLSYEITQGLLKHATKPDHSFFNVREFTSIEAQLTNIADEIAYTNHDIDDGLSSKIITLDDLMAHSRLIHGAVSHVRLQYHGLTKDQLQHLVVSHLIHLQLMDVVVATQKKVDILGICSVDDCQPHARIASFSEDVYPKHRELKQYLYTALYSHPSIREKNAEGQAVIECLFAYYLENPDRLPEHAFEDIESNPAMARRIVADYIAGMTDHYAEKCAQGILT